VSGTWVNLPQSILHVAVLKSAPDNSHLPKQAFDTGQKSNLRTGTNYAHVPEMAQGFAIGDVQRLDSDKVKTPNHTIKTYWEVEL
jgi:hypothetical protein